MAFLASAIVLSFSLRLFKSAFCLPDLKPVSSEGKFVRQAMCPTIRQHLWMLWLKRLPLPTNKRLKKLFTGTDHILIKEDGVYEGRAQGETIVLSLTDPKDLKKFQELMEIIEPRKPHACMCLGDHAIELYKNGELRSTIGFHHGSSIRYHTWRSDAELAKAEQLMEFLWEKGLLKPIEEREEKTK
jgi:hypothetical protein